MNAGPSDNSFSVWVPSPSSGQPGHGGTPTRGMDMRYSPLAAKALNINPLSQPLLVSQGPLARSVSTNPHLSPPISPRALTPVTSSAYFQPPPPQNERSLAESSAPGSPALRYAMLPPARSPLVSPPGTPGGPSPLHIHVPPSPQGGELALQCQTGGGGLSPAGSVTSDRALAPWERPRSPALSPAALALAEDEEGAVPYGGPDRSIFTPIVTSPGSSVAGGAEEDPEEEEEEQETPGIVAASLHQAGETAALPAPKQVSSSRTLGWRAKAILVAILVLGLALLLQGVLHARLDVDGLLARRQEALARAALPGGEVQLALTENVAALRALTGELSRLVKKQGPAAEDPKLIKVYMALEQLASSTLQLVKTR